VAAWPVVDDAIQLGFPELGADGQLVTDVAELHDALERLVAGVRSIIRTLDDHRGAADQARIHHLELVCARHAPHPVVAFAQFADTAMPTFRGCRHLGGVALVTGRGAQIASGRVAVDDVVRRFDIDGAPAPSALPLNLLVSTDVLSEGLSLRRAAAIVHLDFPWTMARLEQRVGRLRRLGSPHARIAVYAIGPPVSSRALASVVRALQRKARLAIEITGHDRLATAVPLLGSRLARATASVVQRAETGGLEALCRALSLWARGGEPPSAAKAATGQAAAIALIVRGVRHRLIALVDGGVTERAAEVLRVVDALSVAARDDESVPESPPGAMLTIIQRWLDEENGRQLVQPVLDAQSPTQIAVLRALQELLERAGRFERAGLVAKIERSRQLVMSARGVGAERALAALLERAGPLDLDRLEEMLAGRVMPAVAAEGGASLVALLCQGRGPGSRSGWLAPATT
jgi:hypothetical protein